MAGRAVFAEQAVRLAQRLVAEGGSVREVKAGLSVVLSASLGLANGEVAKLLGVGSATVVRLHGEVRQRQRGALPQRRARGGRRHEYLSPAQEEAFLRPWEERAAEGGVLVVGPIRQALEARLGHPVAASTVYRLLARHGWRRVAPDSAHPKRDAQAQEAFKKGASRKVWLKR